jgi:hypothetical protein
VKAILKDLLPNEVSLVGRAANRRTYLLLKNEDGGTQVKNEVVEAIVGTEAENEEEFRSILAKSDVTGDNADGLIAAFRLFNAYRESISPEAVAGLAGAMGLDTESGDGTGGAGDGDPGIAKADGKPDLTKVPENLRGEIEGIFKSMNDMKDQNEALRVQVEKSQRAERRREFVTKAESMSNLPSIEGMDMADVLMGISDKAPDEFVVLEKLLTGMDALVAKSALFTAQGSGGAYRPDSAEADLNIRAESLIKSDPTLTKAKAMDLVFKTDRDLEARYVEEQRNG